jgi:hypothetical protein
MLYQAQGHQLQQEATNAATWKRFVQTTLFNILNIYHLSYCLLFEKNVSCEYIRVHSVCVSHQERQQCPPHSPG